MIQPHEHTILLVSDDAELCAAARRKFEVRDHKPRITAVGSVEAALRVLENAAPTVILFEEASTNIAGDACKGSSPRLNSIVAALAVYAPVVVIGEEEQQEELAALLAAGAADFVPRGNGSCAVAFSILERRLTQGRQLAGRVREVLVGDEQNGERFGEMLRHELNNPLTGILGNAELLLAEVRRKNDGRMPQGGQQRLETIAALAVRLRETVRRLSQDWESRQHAAQ